MLQPKRVGHTDAPHHPQHIPSNITAMEAINSTSSSPFHYSRQATGLMVSTGTIALVLIIAWMYIYHRGGLAEMLHTFRERCETKRKARDIEVAEVA